ncbi:PREDICTED: pectinesterase-like isoform X2 [Ipomoea nil]|uniref:pectinesterase-like isoform X2 n=1 Tax=Ipomoea nil TaxID=35883 RepID=UPI000901BE92|nr:PREDICTED: pectinesterase-like isoform X2 [Ipomoea nil]
MEEDGNQGRKIVVLVMSSVLLVAMVVAIVIGSQYQDETVEMMTASQKAIDTVCQPTMYKQTCVDSLSSSRAANSGDPNELIMAAFNVTIDDLRKSMGKSELLVNLKDNPRSKMALEDCQELAQKAIRDLQRTRVKFGNFDHIDMDSWLADLKAWLSGSLTYQETCISGFQEIPGNDDNKMREILTKSMQLTSNALAIVTQLSDVFISFGTGHGAEAPSPYNQDSISHLLSPAQLQDFPGWLSSGRRRLLKASLKEIEPDLVVAKDGSGNYTSINDALKNIPTKSDETFVLYIKEGVYEEQVTFFRNLTNLVVVGDGPTKTKITGGLNFIDGVSTLHTATVVVVGDFFMARDIGFENSAGAEKHQAVALRVGADKTIFYNCRMDGYQDTLYAHTYRQFYRNCEISGTIDFIFGDSAAVFQNCTIVVRKPLEKQQNIVTAQGRKDPHQPTGLVLQNCTIVADPDYGLVKFKVKSYLGRPWKEYSRTIIMESFIPDFIQPEGWLPWDEDFAFQTLFYSEFNNRGPGASKSKRVTWHGIKELPASQIKRFTPGKFITGNTWIKKKEVPYNAGFIYPLPKKDKSIKYSDLDDDDFKDIGDKEKEAYVSRPPPLSISISPSPAPTPSLAPSPSPSPAPTPSLAEPSKASAGI